MSRISNLDVFNPQFLLLQNKNNCGSHLSTAAALKMPWVPVTFFNDSNKSENGLLSSFYIRKQAQRDGVTCPRQADLKCKKEESNPGHSESYVLRRLLVKKGM